MKLLFVILFLGLFFAAVIALLHAADDDHWHPPLS